MGNAVSSQIQEAFPFLSQVLHEEPVQTLLSAEIQNLTYDKFISLIGELNLLSKQCLDSKGKQLVFAVKKDTDATILWKATVQIACVKIDPQSKKVDSYRLLSLTQFLKVFKTLKCQSSAAEHSKKVNAKELSVSTFFEDIDFNSDNADKQTECCICLERKQEVTLPCTHSYCLPCLEEWNELHDTCPICRQQFESSDDTWILSEVPGAEEISKEIQENLLDLTEDCSSSDT